MLPTVGRVLTIACLALVTAGCAASPGPAGRQTDRLSVVTAFYPFAYVAEQIAGPYASVSSLTAPGAEPHDVELTPRQVGSVSTADLVVYERGFQPAVDEAVAQSGNGRVLDTTSVVPLRPLAMVGAAPQPPEQNGAAHDHETLDPHVWLDPLNVAAIAATMADRLAGLDPAHAEDYRRNQRALGHDLSQLDGEYRAGLGSCRRKVFVTTHAAFGYLSARYGLTQIGISGISPDTEPSPARIAEVQRIARQYRLTTIFSETLVSPAVAASIAGDLGLRTDVLDPIEGITAESSGSDYGSVMRANLVALRRANGCP